GELVRLRCARCLDGIGRDQIRIFGNAIVVGLSAEHVRMEDPGALAGVEQKAATDAIVDARDWGAGFGAPAACLVARGGRRLDDDGARSGLGWATRQGFGNAIV